jgi:hypothetical protein
MSDGISRAGWDLDLEYGESREHAIREILCARIGGRVEVKSDAKAATTGNVFLEIKQHGRMSGLATTTADWWAIEIGDTWLIVPTKRLKAAAILAKSKWGTKQGGDFDNYTGVLVPVTWLVNPWRDT